MRINKIKLCNFGSFENEIELDIAVTNEEKNVVLIGGRNGSGKTTLFTAIRLALYGYAAFGYQSSNSSYFNSLKRLINRNSLGKKGVTSYISLEFSLNEDREIADYIVTREWAYDNKKLKEVYTVVRNGVNLEEDDIFSFESYIKSLIPPQLFDLFFFDGEKITEFFLEGNTAKNLREAFLVLCGYDTFDIIKNNFKRNMHISQLIANQINKKIMPDFDMDSFEVIHGLSQDEEGEVLSLIKHIESQDINKIKACKEEIAKSIEKVQDLKKKLEIAESNDQLSSFIEEIGRLDNELQSLSYEKGRITDYINGLEELKKDLENKEAKAMEVYRKSLKEKSIGELCSSGFDMLEELIPVLIGKKLDKLMHNFLYMFKTLIAKSNFIDDIYIDKNFNITLYRNSCKTTDEIENMVSKFGVDGLASHLGEKSISVLEKFFKSSKRDALEKAIKSYKQDQIIDLPMRVDINGFSKGEQQIYIMALYWALIKLSVNNIPFIIDTPYARIDALHRENITTRFFPSLSSQVIILSTDEEINDQYYKLIKQFVAKEYTISYSNTEKCTSVEEKYFFEVIS